MIKFFTSDLRRNLVKIFCLTIGLSIGFLLVARVYFEQTYDTHFQDYERIFRVIESGLNGDEDKEYNNTPGAIGPGLKRYVPQVEASTRETLMLSSGTPIKTEDGRIIESGGVRMADSCFFKVFVTPSVAGNLEESLELKNTCVIPRSLADKIGDNVIGQVLTCPSFSEEYKVMIGGVYEDFPLNSSIGSDHIYLSLPSISVISYDGRDNWMGNDRYMTYVKLAEGVGPGDVRDGIDRMLEENLPAEAIEVYHLNFHLKPFANFYIEQKGVKMTIRILTLLAIIMLMSAGLNYLLVTIGQMEGRSKEMAVRKCYGTSNYKIFARVMTESTIMLLISLGLAILISFCFGEECRKLLGHTPAELYTTGNVMIVELCVILVLLGLTGAIPAWMYCRTPVIHAFRPSVSGRKIWKLSLLSLQFFAAAMLICLLVLVGRQYSMLTKTDLGFEYKNIGHAYIGSIPMDKRYSIVEEIKQVPGVTGVASAYQNFATHASGNNIWTDDSERQKNVADMYQASPNIFEVLGIGFVRGETFRADADSTVHQVIVEEKLVDVLRDYFHLDVDGEKVLGQRFNITEHLGIEGISEFEICGVVKNMQRNGFELESADQRGAVIFPESKRVMANLYVKFDKLTPEAISKVQKIINEIAPTSEVYITPYDETIKGFVEPIKNFGTSVMIVGLVIFVIALIGLTGFVTDEVQRRAKEIAIRKVTGTSAVSIVKLLCVETSRVAVPSLIAGGALAMVVGQEWLSQFTTQVSLSPISMILCLIVLMGFILLIVVLNSMKVASGNPVKYLRDE